jgi:hypothetical protein
VALRTLTIVLAAFATSACTNLVASERPLFPAEAPKTVFRPGLWSGPRDSKCQFDPAAPRAKWPDCADAFEMSERGPVEDKNGVYVVADGDPLILQMTSREADTTGRIVTGYLGLKPSRYDAQHRVTQFAVWLVQCGPPYRHPVPKGQPRPIVGDNSTLHPLPGLEMVEKNCLARAPGPVHNAAAKSFRWAGPLMRFSWVRDADPPSPGGANPLTPLGAKPGNSP